MAAADGGAMRVLAWPARANRASNPYTARLADALERRGVRVDEFSIAAALFGRHDIWHVHWPETVVHHRGRLRTLFRLIGFCIVVATLRFKGTRIVWTVHDIGSMERHHPRMESWLHAIFVRRVDAWIALSRDTVGTILAAYPELRGKRGSVVRHGHFRDAIAWRGDRAAARAALGIDPAAPLIVHFGALRDYKNVPDLLRAFRSMSDARLRLVVAGRPADEEIARDLDAAALGDPRIRLVLRHHEQPDLDRVIAAADLVVLPYRRILNSGAAMLALSHDRPVLAPALGAMPDLGRAVGESWMRLYRGTLDGATLTAALDWARFTPRAMPCDLGVFDPDATATHTLAVYESLRPEATRDSALDVATRSVSDS